MKFLSTLLTLAIVGYGGYWIFEHKPEVKNQALSYITTTSADALEMRYTANQIIDSHTSLLPKNSLLDPKTTYQPFLLMDVKYLSLDGKSTHEGVMLWDMIQGELVIDTKTWKTTHGFSDCISVNATAADFKLIQLLSQKNLDRESLILNLHVEPQLAAIWIEQAQKKKLIVHSDNTYRLHFESPNIVVSPSTKLAFPLFTRSASIGGKATRRYTPSQIKRTCEAAFGGDFAIRHMREVYLPVHIFTVRASDGTLTTHQYNGLTGRRL